MVTDRCKGGGVVAPFAGNSQLARVYYFYTVLIGFSNDDIIYQKSISDSSGTIIQSIEFGFSNEWKWRVSKPDSPQYYL